MAKSRTPSPSANARARAAEQFSRALERITTLDEAWRFVLSVPRGVAPDERSVRTSRLSQFLKRLTPPPNATREERQAYLALIRRFLSSAAMDEATAKRAIAVLMEVDRDAK